MAKKTRKALKADYIAGIIDYAAMQAVGLINVVVRSTSRRGLNSGVEGGGGSLVSELPHLASDKVPERGMRTVDLRPQSFINQLHLPTS